MDEHAELLAKAAGWLGGVRLLGCKLRHKRNGWTRRLGRRSALTLWQEGHTKRPVGFSLPSMAQDVLRAVEAGGEARQ